MKRVTLETDNGNIINFKDNCIQWFTPDGHENWLTLDEFYSLMANWDKWKAEVALENRRVK